MEEQKNKVLGIMLQQMFHVMHTRLGESYWRIAKGSGVRQESVALAMCGNGRLESFGAILDYFCREHKIEAYQLFYNLSIEVAQQRLFS